MSESMPRTEVSVDEVNAFAEQVLAQNEEQRRIDAARAARMQAAQDAAAKRQETIATKERLTHWFTDPETGKMTDEVANGMKAFMAEVPSSYSEGYDKQEQEQLTTKPETLGEKSLDELVGELGKAPGSRYEGFVEEEIADRIAQSGLSAQDAEYVLSSAFGGSDKTKQTEKEKEKAAADAAEAQRLADEKAAAAGAKKEITSGYAESLEETVEKLRFMNVPTPEQFKELEELRADIQTRTRADGTTEYFMASNPDQAISQEAARDIRALTRRERWILSPKMAKDFGEALRTTDTEGNVFAERPRARRLGPNPGQPNHDKDSYKYWLTDLEISELSTYRKLKSDEAELTNESYARMLRAKPEHEFVGEFIDWVKQRATLHDSLLRTQARERVAAPRQVDEQSVLRGVVNAATRSRLSTVVGGKLRGHAARLTQYAAEQGIAVVPSTPNTQIPAGGGEVDGGAPAAAAESTPPTSEEPTPSAERRIQIPRSLSEGRVAFEGVKRSVREKAQAVVPVAASTILAAVLKGRVDAKELRRQQAERAAAEEERDRAS